MTRRRASIFGFILTLITVLLTYGGQQFVATHPTTLPGAQQQVAPGFYRVVRVNDGDTIVVDMNGTQESVRMIGVDTPETHKPNTPVQCFGPEASDFTHHTLDGAAVRLEADPTNDNRDRYDRLLRYVYLPDGSLFQKTLVTQGYGFAYTSFPFQKKDEFVQAQTDAQTARRGLWAACQTKEQSGRWQTL